MQHPFEFIFDITRQNHKAHIFDSPTSRPDYTITKYELSDDKNVLTTTYSKDGASDVVISVDKKNATATVGTEVYDLADCIEGGLTE